LRLGRAYLPELLKNANPNALYHRFSGACDAAGLFLIEFHGRRGRRRGPRRGRSLRRGAVSPAPALDAGPVPAHCGNIATDYTGRVVGALAFQTAVEEIIDVQLLPGLRFPDLVGFRKDTVEHTFIVPCEGQPARAGNGAALLEAFRACTNAGG